ncbi:MAG TPA: leucyl/phenylalanyl-tRNA--protein transferase [Verrucomicrobiales bacterium]|nr:leucyl/phenylalanyl-tRNA--protein transferase [Verrucomicrobiales bacterium]
MIYELNNELWFPHPGGAEKGEYDGLVAIGGDLSTERLLLAYRTGIFPWSVRPITWWSPDPRAVLEVNALHLPRSLRRVLQKNAFEVTMNRAFADVIQACATVARRDRSWISPEFVAAYTRLHESGHAHSVECWSSGRLVGGVYGVAAGGLFAGESMFHLESNASKVALVHLIRHLRGRGFTLFDVQMVTPTTAQLGAREISRTEYLARLSAALQDSPSFG